MKQHVNQNVIQICIDLKVKKKNTKTITIRKNIQHHLTQYSLYSMHVSCES